MSIPGIFNNLIRGNITRNVSGPSTKRVLVIGTALDGPINEPTRISSPTDVDALFGPAIYNSGYFDPALSDTESLKYNGATIPLDVKRLIDAGAQDIVVIRFTGTFATNSTAFTSSLDLRALYPGRIYNSATVTASATASASSVTFTIGQPDVKGGDFSVTKLNFTIAEWINLINSHPKNKTIFIDPNAFPIQLPLQAHSALPSGQTIELMTGGTNGTDAPGEDYADDKFGMATLLTATDTGTFDVLEGMKEPFDFAVLSALYMDDEVVDGDASKSIYKDFGTWIENMSIISRPCVGLLGTRPSGIRDTAALITYITGSLLSVATGYQNQDQNWIKAGPFLNEGIKATDFQGKIVNLGSRVMVCGGPDAIFQHPDIGRYTDCFHVALAGVLSTLPPERSATNRSIPGILGYVNRIPGKYADQLIEGVGADFTQDLSGNGAYVVLVPDTRRPNGPYKIYSDVTTAPRTDFFHRYQLLHLMNSVQADISDSLFSYIGGPSSPQILAAMKTDVRNILDGYTQNNAFRGGEGAGYNFEIEMRGADQILGIVRIFLDIAPATSVHRIQIVAQVTNPS